MAPSIEPPLAFFQKPGKTALRDSVEAAQVPFGLVQKFSMPLMGGLHGPSSGIPIAKLDKKTWREALPCVPNSHCAEILHYTEWQPVILTVTSVVETS